MTNSVVYGQITPDATLGIESSVVVPNDTSIWIEGGATRAQNLFHSFSDLNVAVGQRVYFSNPTLIEHIFSRVTGTQSSHILGQLGVDGPADLYLLNPNGIVFGPEASLNVENSFSASTATAMGFTDGSEFSATVPGDVSLLTVSLPLGLQTGYVSPNSRIENAGNLELSDGQVLSLMSGNIENTGLLQSPGGVVQLVGDRIELLNDTEIDVSSPTGGGQVLIGQDAERSRTASHTYIDENAVINASANEAGIGGQVIIWSTEQTIFAGLILARGGEQSGDGGFVEVSGERGLAYRGQVDAGASAGQAGVLLIDPTNIEVVDSNADTLNLADVDQAADPDISLGISRIAASAISGSSTNVILSAANDIVFNADVNITSAGIGLTANAGNDIVINNSIETSGGGEIRLNADRNISLTNLGSFVWSYGEDIQLIAGNVVSLQGGAQIDTAPFLGDSGNLTINAHQLTMADGSQLKVAPFSAGRGGALTLNIADRTDLVGIGLDPFGNLNSTGLVASDPLMASSQVSGTIDISIRELSLREGASIGAQRAGATTGGNVTIRNAELVEVIGSSPSSSPDYVSGIFASPDVSGSANVIDINADRLIVRDGGLISSNTDSFDVAAAGSVILDVNTISLSGRSEASGSISGLTARSFGFGPPGNVSIREAQSVSVTGGATIDVSSLVPTGTDTDQFGAIIIDTASLELSDRAMLIANNLGAITIKADDTVVVDNATIFGDGALGAAASLILIKTDNLLVSNGSLISTSTYSSQDSGNIVLDVDRVFRLDNAFVSTASVLGDGPGGKITVEAQELVLNNRASIDTAAISQGNAGNLSIDADTLLLGGQSQLSVSGIQAESRTGNLSIRADSVQVTDDSRIEAVASSSNGGDILLDLTNSLILRRGGSISAEAGTEDASILVTPAPGLGDGGNVTIRVPFIVAIPNENSDISANAFLGNGGRVDITAQGLFGIEFREQRTDLSDITASSEFGLNGIVAINAPDTSALQDGLTQLSDSLIDSDVLVATSCITRRSAQADNFIVGNSAGLPEQPNMISATDFSTGAVQTVPAEAAWQNNQLIVEPDAVYQLADGRLVMSRYCD
ncbi:MAG: filamentous hemagglutinin N-terminal domain-containing protein [Phormidesmis sp.]